MELLIREYQETLKETRKIKRELENKLRPYKDIYQDKSRPMRERYEAKTASHDLRVDLSTISSWESNLLFSIEWMTSARCPSSSRGIERRAAYEREKPFDPILMQRFFRSEENVYSWDNEQKESSLSQKDKERINKVLSVLTDKEREVYLMSRGQCFSQYSIARKMNISRDSVKTMLKRAENKIAKALATSKKAGDMDGIRTANSR